MSSDKKVLNNEDSKKKEYNFGSLIKYNLEEIESEVLSDSVYLDVFAGSDLAFKENIQDTNSVLDNVMKLKTVTYNYKTESFPEQNFPNDNQIGFIANQVEELFPHLVKKDENGNRFVNYSLVTPILTKTIQELNQKIEDQDRKINALMELLKKTNV